jgi:hypothetical protein
VLQVGCRQAQHSSAQLLSAPHHIMYF